MTQEPRNCLSCNSSRILHFGIREAGSLWCFLKRAGVGQDHTCNSFARDVFRGECGIVTPGYPQDGDHSSSKEWSQVSF